jgi:hypothetical protein
LLARLRAGILGKADLDHRVVLPGRSSIRRADAVRAAFGGAAFCGIDAAAVNRRRLGKRERGRRRALDGLSAAEVLACMRPTALSVTAPLPSSSLAGR